MIERRRLLVPCRLCARCGSDYAGDLCDICMQAGFIRPNDALRAEYDAAVGALLAEVAITKFGCGWETFLAKVDSVRELRAKLGLP